jgi:ATP/maltotriose-dependent transcriptional regulator MalT
LRGRALAATATGCAFAYTEEWELALEATQRGVECAKDPFTQVSALWMAAWARAGSGQTAQAIELLTRVTDQLTGHGLRAWSAHAMSIHADAAIRAGDPERAAVLAREALEVALETGDRSCAGWAMRAQGQAACALGQLVAAREALDRALRLFEEMEARVDSAKCLVERAVVGIAEGERAGALADLERARELFCACDVRAPLERVARLEGLLR